MRDQAVGGCVSDGEGSGCLPRRHCGDRRASDLHIIEV